MNVHNQPDRPRSDRRGQFTARIGNEKFEFHDASFDDRKVTGAQIAEAAGAHPVHEFVVLQQLKTFELETVRPTELIELARPARLFVIKGDGTDRFVVDGLSLEWPRKIVIGLTIKRLVGKDADDIELVLEREGAPDKLIDDDEEVRLGRRGVEVFRTRRVKIVIIVNTREKKWEKRRISFEDLVAIAFPTPPTGQCIVYTVTYFDGPPSRPEGTLTAGDSVKVVDRMVFSVKFTDKS